MANVIKFYNSKKERDNDYYLCCNNCIDDNCMYKIITPPNRLLNWQFYTPHDPVAFVNEFKITNKKTGVDYFILNNLIKKRMYTTKDYYYYEGDNHGLYLPCGYYSTRVVLSNGDAYYSDYYYIESGQATTQIIPAGSINNLGGSWNVLSGTWVNGCSITSGSIQLPIAMVSGNQYTFRICTSEQVGQLVVNFAGGDTINVPPGVGCFDLIGIAGNTNSITISNPTSNTVCVESTLLFEMNNDLSDCYNYLKWSHCTNVADTIYSNTLFFNEIFIEKESDVYGRVAKENSEVKKDRLGNEITLFKRLMFEQKMFIGQLPFHLVNSFSEIVMHDNIQIVLKNGGGIKKIKTISLDIDEDNGSNYCSANVGITFSYDDAITTDNCCEPLDEIEPEYCNFIYEKSHAETDVFNEICLGNVPILSCYSIGLPVNDITGIQSALDSIGFGFNWNYNYDNGIVLIAVQFLRPINILTPNSYPTIISIDNNTWQLTESITNTCCGQMYILQSNSIDNLINDFNNKALAPCSCSPPVNTVITLTLNKYYIDGNKINDPSLGDPVLVKTITHNCSTFAWSEILQMEDFSNKSIQHIYNICKFINDLSLDLEWHDTFTTVINTNNLSFLLDATLSLDYCIGNTNMNETIELYINQDNINPNINANAFTGGEYLPSLYNCT